MYIEEVFVEMFIEDDGVNIEYWALTRQYRERCLYTM